MKERIIDSPERMIEVIREFGIIPFFRCAVPGWSIEERTAPGCWFTDEEDGGTLGPWDWKIEAVREGDIAYGKFLGGKAAFATVEWYRELMNWRRSIPKYQMALRKRYKTATKGENTMKELAPVALEAIKEAGALETGNIRKILNVKKSVCDNVMGFLQMGTWTVIGDIQRVYRGPDLHYSGWQRASNTTPDEFFGIAAGTAGPGPAEPDMPAWARRFEEAIQAPAAPHRSPEESRERIINHIELFFPGAYRKDLLKII